MTDSRFSEFDDTIIGLVDETLDLARAHAADGRSLDALTNMYDRWLTTVSQLAVVGPISSGKTMLINALLGRPLLPTDSRAWTSTWVQVFHAPVFSATAVVDTGREMREHQILERELETYLTVGGERQIRRDYGRGAVVVSVAIGIPFTAMSENLRLLDTPGAGGLRDQHLHTARAALSRADAVIFVTRPDTPISSSERRFLAEASRRVATCILVFTHRDTLSAVKADEAVANGSAILCDRQQWERIVDTPKEARELAERFRSVTALSVSSKNWLAALNEPEGAGRTRLAGVSGIPALDAAIEREVVQRIGFLHRQNILILCGLLTTDVIERTEHLRRLLEGDKKAEKVQRNREADIARWTASNGDAWAGALERRRSALHEKLTELAESRVRKLESAYRHELLQMGTEARETAVAVLGAEPQSLLDEMTALGAREIADGLDEVRRLLDEVDLAGPIKQLIAARAVGSRLGETVQPGAPSVEFDAGDLRNVIAGGMVGGGAAGLAVTAGLVAATPLLFLAPILVGAALFGGLTRLQKTKARAGAEAVDYLDRIERLLGSKVVELAAEGADSAVDVMKSEISAALAALEAEIRANRKAMEAAKTASPEERQRKIMEYESLAHQAAELRDKAQELRTALSKAAGSGI